MVNKLIKQQPFRRRALPLLAFLLAHGVLSAVGYAATDPTRPKDFSNLTDDTSRATDSTPRLTSVLIAPNRRLAVIDGHLIAQGQSRGGLQVRQIFEDRVIVRLQGRSEETTLPLNTPHMHKESRE